MTFIELPNNIKVGDKVEFYHNEEIRTGIIKEVTRNRITISIQRLGH